MGQVPLFTTDRTIRFYPVKSLNLTCQIDRKSYDEARFCSHLPLIIRVISVKKITFALLLGVLCFFASTEASAQLQREGTARGPAFSALFGPNFCSNNDTAVCGSTNVGIGTGVGFHYRFVAFFSLDLDFVFGTFSSDEYPREVHKNNQLRLLLGPTFHVPFQAVDLSLFFGIGWGRHNFAVQEIADLLESTWEENNSFLMNFGASVDYRMFERVLLGAIVRYMLPVAGKTCGYHETFNVECSRGRPQANIMFGFHIVVHLLPPRETNQRQSPRDTHQRDRPRRYQNSCTCSDGSSGFRTHLLDGSVMCNCSQQSDLGPDPGETSSATEQRDAPQRGSGDRVCDPGATQQCFCVGGAGGVQVCEDSGMRWGACRCTSPSGQSEPVEEQSAPYSSENPFD